MIINKNINQSELKDCYFIGTNIGKCSSIYNDAMSNKILFYNFRFTEQLSKKITSTVEQFAVLQIDLICDIDMRVILWAYGEDGQVHEDYEIMSSDDFKKLLR